MAHLDLGVMLVLLASLELLEQQAEPDIPEVRVIWDLRVNQELLVYLANRVLLVNRDLLVSKAFQEFQDQEDNQASKDSLGFLEKLVCRDLQARQAQRVKLELLGHLDTKVKEEPLEALVLKVAI